VDPGDGIGVYGGKNALWTLLHHRKMTKKRPIMRTFIQLLTIFLQKRAAFDHFLTIFSPKMWTKQFGNRVVVRISLLFLGGEKMRTKIPCRGKNERKLMVNWRM